MQHDFDNKPKPCKHPLLSVVFQTLGGGGVSVGSRAPSPGLFFPPGASVPSVTVSITAQAFASLVLVHRGRRSNLWALQ